MMQVALSDSGLVRFEQSLRTLEPAHAITPS
jgi:hypothetical protein